MNSNPDGDAERNPNWARANGAAALYAPFRPRRARFVVWIFGGIEVVVLLGLAAFLPATGPIPFHWPDRLGVVLVALAVVLVLSRFARLRAVPSPAGLRVRNVLFTRRLAWAQIVSVQFGGGNPWAVLDLTDGDTLAVMAVQRADGERAMGEARRLATLVALHTRTDHDD